MSRVLNTWHTSSKTKLKSKLSLPLANLEILSFYSIIDFVFFLEYIAILDLV